LIIDEAAIEQFFNKRNLHDTKYLLERRGKVSEIKYESARVLFAGASVLMTTNTLDLTHLSEYD